MENETIDLPLSNLRLMFTLRSTSPFVYESHKGQFIGNVSIVIPCESIRDFQFNPRLLKALLQTPSSFVCFGISTILKNMLLLRNKLFFQYKKMYMQKLFMYHVFENIYTSDFNFDSNFYGNLIFERQRILLIFEKATYFTYLIDNQCTLLEFRML